MTYQLLNTLYITQPESYARLENQTIRVDVEHEKRFQVPLHHLGSVVCFGPTVKVSAPLMYQLAESGISLVFCDANGRFKARLEGPVSGNVLLRQAQHAAMTDGKACLELARSFVAGKIKNTRHVLLRGGRDSKSPEEQLYLKEVADNLTYNLRSLPEAETIDAVRGIEGDAAKRYFEAFSFLIRPDIRSEFTLNGRTRRPPRDRMNALLSFLYSLLMNDCRSGLECVGLDPQMGFLHAVRPGRASLALDLMEEFRPWLADRLALTLVNRQQIKSGDFIVETGGAVLLKDQARRELLIAYQDRKKELVTHPFLVEKLPAGLTPQLQARLLARVLRGDTPYYIPLTLK